MKPSHASIALSSCACGILLLRASARLQRGLKQFPYRCPRRSGKDQVYHGATGREGAAPQESYTEQSDTSARMHPTPESIALFLLPRTGLAHLPCADEPSRRLDNLPQKISRSFVAKTALSLRSAPHRPRRHDRDRADIHVGAGDRECYRWDAPFPEKFPAKEQQRGLVAFAKDRVAFGVGCDSRIALFAEQ